MTIGGPLLIVTSRSRVWCLTFVAVIGICPVRTVLVVFTLCYDKRHYKNKHSKMLQDKHSKMMQDKHSKMLQDFILIMI